MTWQNRDLVFPNQTGGFLDPHHLLQEFYEIRARAALPSLHFHDLRAAKWWALRKQ